MFVFGNLFVALAKVVDILLTIYWFILIIRIVSSWLGADKYNPIVQFLYAATEPVLMPVRRLFPPMRIDFSPIIVFIALSFLKSFLVATLYDIGVRMKY